MSSITDPDAVWLGLDVSKDSISAGWLRPGSDTVQVDRVFHDEPSVRRLVSGVDPARLRVCYEAGPTGYELARLLSAMGIHCDVIAPSLLPKAPGERVKTDRRDCRRLVGLYRAGQLVPVHVPTVTEEAVRDLCRARQAARADRRRARQRLAGWCLRHGRVYRDGSLWTHRHQQWLTRQTFDQPALTATLAAYRATVAARDAELASLDDQLADWYHREPFADPVARLGAYRGIGQLGALSMVAEVGDWRRFAHAGSFMSFVGLVPSEYSSGATIRRGRLTRAGNVHVRTQLIESAWSYQHRPAIGAALAARQADVGADTLARSWTAQQRLCRRFRRLAARKHQPNVVVAAVARELAGFVWAEMTADAR